MQFAVGLLSFAFPPCTSIGNSPHHMPFTPPWPAGSDPATRTSTHYPHSVYGHEDFRGNLTRAEPIATALQQKVSD
jgi:hypothetical protein